MSRIDVFSDVLNSFNEKLLLCSERDIACCMLSDCEVVSAQIDELVLSGVQPSRFVDRMLFNKRRACVLLGCYDENCSVELCESTSVVADLRKELVQAMCDIARQSGVSVYVVRSQGNLSEICGEAPLLDESVSAVHFGVRAISDVDMVWFNAMSTQSGPFYKDRFASTIVFSKGFPVNVSDYRGAGVPLYHDVFVYRCAAADFVPDVFLVHDQKVGWRFAFDGVWYSKEASVKAQPVMLEEAPRDLFSRYRVFATLDSKMVDVSGKLAAADRWLAFKSRALLKNA